MTRSRESAPARRRVRRRLVLIALAAAAAVLAVSSFSVWRDRNRSDLERAQELVSNDDGFDTGLEAGETLARVAQHLERAVDGCRAAGRGATCQALASALGYSQVLAAFMLECSAPGRFDARERMSSHLEDAAAVQPDTGRLPSPPPLPSCHG